MSKSKNQKMSLATFNSDFGGSWADDVTDLPTATAASSQSFGASAYSSTPREPTKPLNLESQSARSAMPFSNRRDEVARQFPDRPPFEIFIGNLSWETKPQDMPEFFQGLQVIKVRFPPEVNGKPRGFGHVEFGSLEDLKRALTYDGDILRGRNVKIDLGTKNQSSKQGGFQQYDRKPSFGERDSHFDRKPSFGERDSKFSFGEQRDAGFQSYSSESDTKADWRSATKKPFAAPSNSFSTSSSSKPAYSGSFSTPRPEFVKKPESNSTPMERPKLVLQPRTIPIESFKAPIKDGSSAILTVDEDMPKKQKPNPFGNAKPKDQTEILRQLEEKLVKEKEEQKLKDLEEKAQKEKELLLLKAEQDAIRISEQQSLKFNQQKETLSIKAEETQDALKNFTISTSEKHKRPEKSYYDAKNAVKGPSDSNDWRAPQPSPTVQSTLPPTSTNKKFGVKRDTGENKTYGGKKEFSEKGGKREFDNKPDSKRDPLEHKNKEMKPEIKIKENRDKPTKTLTIVKEKVESRNAFDLLSELHRTTFIDKSMLISKSPPEKLTPPPPPIKDFIQKLLDCSDDQLVTELLPVLGEWPLPKSDLFHWIAVLNRFDSLLEVLAKKYISVVQLTPFEDLDKALILSILKLEKHLWETCTNRNLYNSYDRLNVFLCTSDLDVLESILRLLLRPAQRISSQRSLRSGLSIAEKRLRILACTWNIKSYGLETKQLVNPTAKVTLKNKRFKFAFYHASHVNKPQDLTASPIRPPPDLGPGHVDLPLKHLSYEQVISELDIPEKDQFHLYHQIRLVNSLNDYKKRLQMFLIQLYALSVYVHLVEEEDFYSHFLIHSPDYIHDLTDLILEYDTTRMSIDTAIMCTLDSLTKFKSKQTEILTAFSAAVYHGTILKLLRSIIQGMHEPVSVYSQEFIDAVFNFIATVLSSQSSGIMLISAGIIEAFLSAFSVTNSASYKNVVKCTTSLDNIIYSFNSALNTFTHAGGLEILVEKIKQEIQFCESTKMDVDTKQTPFPADNILLIRAILKLILHLMQSSGTSEGMRNLIDSSLPKSLGTIMSNAHSYSANVYGIAITIMATFIHNEPTSLPILQEIKLPNIFLQSLVDSFPVSPEVITAIPNAFGAICLNQAGLDLFNEIKPMSKYLRTLILEENLRSLYDNDVAVLVGNSVDELMRHHPTIKQDIFTAILDMIKAINEYGAQPQEHDRGFCSLLQSDIPQAETANMSHFVDVIGRFLEGLFQNTAHSKDFLKLGGVDSLVQLLTLPSIPYDFASSTHSYSFSHVFRILLDSNSVLASDVIGPIFTLHLNNVTSFVEEGNKIVDLVSVTPNTPTELLLKYNNIYRSLIIVTIFLRVFTDSFTSPNSKSLNCVLSIFSSDKGLDLLAHVGKIHTQAHWENIILKFSLPKELFAKKKEKASLERESPLDFVRKELEDQGDDNESAFESKNAKHVRFLLAQICLMLPPLLQNILKVVSNRRVTDSGNRKQAQAIIDQIGSNLSLQFSYSPINSSEPINLYTYITMISGCLISIITDDRGSSGILTNILLSFVKANGLEKLLDLFQILLDSITKSDHEETNKRLFQAIDLVISLLSNLVNQKMIHESPNTTFMVNRDRNPAGSNYFNPFEFVISLRLSIATALKKYWNSDYLIKLPQYIIKHFILTIKHIISADGEIDTNDSSQSTLANAISSLTASLASRQATQLPVAPRPVDEGQVQTLIDMGFSRIASTTSLRRFRNIEQAAEYLLNNPHLALMAEPEPAATATTTSALASLMTANEPLESGEIREDDLDEEDEDQYEDIEEDEEDEEEDDDPMEEDQMHAETEPPAKISPKSNLLDSIRSEITQASREIIFKVLDLFDDLAFEIKDFLAILEKDHIDEFVSILISDIKKLQMDLQTDKKSFKNKLRLFAMFANDQNVQSKAIKTAGSFIPALIDIVKEQVISEDFYSMTSTLLSIESYISLSNEPRPDILVGSTTSDILELPEPIPIEQLERLANHLLDILQKVTVEKDLLNAIYRLLARLTRSNQVTNVLMVREGLSLLFKPNLLAIFPGQQTLLVMILRHIIENDEIIQKIISNEIKHSLSFPRMRVIEVSSFLKSGSGFICRSPNEFLKTVENILHLPAYVPGTKSYQIGLKDLKLKPDEDQEIYIPSKFSETLAQFLINEFLNMMPVSSAENMSEADIENLKKDQHIKRCYILQNLEELTISYPTFKMDILSASSRKGKSAASPFKQKNQFLYYLLNDLIPHASPLKQSSEETDALYSDASYASSLVIAMCTFPKEEKEESQKSTEFKESCIHIVLDAIVRVIKEMLVYSGNMDLLYQKMAAIAQLIYDIPTAKDVSVFASSANSHETSGLVVKIMLEKNFVTYLTQMASDLDIHHPDSKLIMKHILKPLEYLTTFANKLDESVGFKIQGEEQDEHSEDDGSNELEAEMMEREEARENVISELTRNSALYAFNAADDDEDEDMNEMSDIDEDEMYDVYDEDDGDPDEEIESDVQDDMEIILPAPYHNEDEDSDNSSDNSSESSDDDHDHDHENDDEPDIWEDVEDDGENPNEQDQSEDEEEDEDQVPQEDDEYESEIELDGEDFINLFDGNAEMVGDEFNDRGSNRRFQFARNYATSRRSLRSRMLADNSQIGAVQIQWHLNGGDSAAPTSIFTSNRRPRGLDVVTHPLLTAAADPAIRSDTTQQRRDLSSIIRASSGDRLDFQAFEDLIGGQALQFIEQFISRSTQSQIPITNRNETATFELRNAQIEPTTEATTPEVKDERMAAIHNFNVSKTIDRWTQEAKFMYGSQTQDKSLRLLNAVLNVLIPVAEKDYLKQKAEQEEKKKAAEEERVRKEKEEEELKKEQERLKALEKKEEVVVVEPVPAEPVKAAQPVEPTPEPERVFINVEGVEVDITGSGMDPEFLNALPDDLRQEVIAQHLRDQRRALAPSNVPESINQDFLNALPFDIREEIIQYERLESERRTETRARAVEPTQAPTGTGSSLRFFGRLPNATDPVTTPVLKEKTGKKVMETTQLVEKQGLISLMKLLFVPDPSNTEMINRVITNFTYNPKNRAELIALILSILLEENEMGSQDKSKLKNKPSLSNIQASSIPSSSSTPHATPKQMNRTPSQSNFPQTPSITSITSGVLPNLIPERSLELLYHVVTHHPQICRYFLLESELFHSSFNKCTRHSKKTKSHKSNHKYPIVVLLQLLDKPSFLNNSSLMETLMQIISIIMRSLPVLIKRSKNGEESKDSKTSETMSEETVSNPMEVHDIPDTSMETTSPSVEEVTMEVATLQPESESNQPKPVSEEETPKEKVKKAPFSYKHPNLHENQLKGIVSVLKRGECSNKAFQYTLAIIQQLSEVAEYKEDLSTHLGEAAVETADSMLSDLNQLTEYLEGLDLKSDLDSQLLLKFSSPSSEETKLLRVLKSIDFLHRNSEVAKEKDIETESKLLQSIFHSFKLKELWIKLSRCLELIQVKENAKHIANVLLPLIEAFMVVSKPYVAIQKAPKSIMGKSMSEMSLVSNEEMFFTFTEEHKKILNHMVRNNPSLMSGSFALLVHNPKVLEFSNKRTYFIQQLHKKSKRDHYGNLNLNVRRQYVFEDSYHQLQGRTGDEIKYSKLTVKFSDEEGVDAGGVTREWFSVLARQMFNPDYALFRPSAADKVTYQPNRSSWINPDHLLYFKFVGRVIGKAIYDGRLLDAYFTRSFYKCMLEISVDWRDMEAVDPEFHKSLEWILNNDITDVLDLTFSCEVDDFGNKKIVDLKPDGQNIAVSEHNKLEYVKLITQQRLVTAINPQIESFTKGFHEVISKELIKIFNEQELELLISGLPDIDIDDWKNNTEYQNYTLSSPQIQWFWRAVRSFTQEERAKLIQFVTGTSKVPLEGFKVLQGSGGIQKFQIHKDFSTNRLPSAHTCFNQLDLPQYESYDILRANLLTSIVECGTGFGFA